MKTIYKGDTRYEKVYEQMQMLGIQDVVAKSLGSQNPYNMIRATISGLTKEWSPRMVAQRRGKKVADINFK